MIQRLLLLLPFLFLAASPAFAQNQEEQIAIQHYQEGEYEKALPLLDELFWRNPGNNYLYSYYFNTLVNLQEYNEAEKSLKKLIRRQEDLNYMVDLGYVYQLQGQQEKANDQYEEALEGLQPSVPATQRLANAFFQRGLTKYAIQTYEHGRKLVKEPTEFAIQLATLYKQEGDLEKMLAEHLRVLEQSPRYMTALQSNLQDLAVDEENYQELKGILLQQVQDNPSNVEYAELLSWLFTQRKDWKMAFIQLKALDRRLNEQGHRLVPLARTAASNEAYDVAEEIYSYILSEFGEDGSYYFPARRGYLDVKYQRITEQQDYTPEDVQTLVTAYEGFLNRWNSRTEAWAQMLLQLAEMKAVYQDQPQDALELLKPLINSPTMDRFWVARGKISAGDYYVMADDIWEAALLYGQVEKDFKDHPLGSQAKFKNAKLSFYRGDFEWAQAQLKVLKGSTSELIANDALQLDMTITDNLGLDTTPRPLMLYAQGDFAFFKRNFDIAEITFDSVLTNYPGHTLTDEIYLRKGDMRSRQGKWQEALEHYDRVFSVYHQDILADDALIRSARIYEEKLNDPAKAKELYEKLILEHPDSIFSVEAREKYRKLRGDSL